MTIESYDDVVSLYSLLSSISCGLGLSRPNVTGRFHFYIGKISCVCNSYKEFVEEAYGTESFRFISASIYINDRNETVVSIQSIGGDSVSASADSRIVLEKFFTQLETTQKSAQNIDNGITQTIIDSVIINGNRNVVANNKSQVNAETDKKESGFRKFCVDVLQDIMSNFIWYLLTLGAGVLLTYLAMK